MHSLKNDVLYSLFPNGKYLTYSSGSTNILLTAPHGGGIKPRDIPKRKYGKVWKDTYTRRLIEKTVKYLSPVKAFYVYSDIHRSKVDLNRDIVEAAQGNKKAEKIWRDWNTLVKYYQRSIIKKFGSGLYIDIHSHNDNDCFQLGYDISAKEYIKLFSTGNTNSKTTVDSLGRYQLFDALFGEHSFHNQLKFYGYKPFLPTGDEGYFNGGRNIEVYSGNGISSIQIECPVSVLKYELDSVAMALSEIIIKFRDTFIY